MLPRPAHHQEVRPRMRLPLAPLPRQAIGPRSIQATTLHILLLRPLSLVDLLLMGGMGTIMSTDPTEALHSLARLPMDLQAGVLDSHRHHHSPVREKGMEDTPPMDNQAGSLRLLHQVALATHTLSLLVLGEGWASLEQNHLAHPEDLPLNSPVLLPLEGIAMGVRIEAALAEVVAGEQECRKETIDQVCRTRRIRTLL